MNTADIAERIETCAMPKGRCLAGFSGGADSTLLLYLLAAQRDMGNVQPEAVHVNHGLRGQESDRDENFCRELCEKLSIPFHAVHLELKGKTDENSCRKHRFRSFETVLYKTGIKNLVLAHNRDDLSETFLMRLLRGTGTEGLACMQETDEREGYTIFRPLLRAGREEIRSCLSMSGVKWREDSSNSDARYLRNRIRAQLIPLLEEMAGGATERIARTAHILAGDNLLLQQEANRYVLNCSDSRRIQTDCISGLPESMQRRVLRTWWNMYMPDLEEHTLNARQTDELAALLHSEHGKVNLPGGLYAVKGRNGIYLTGVSKKAMQEITYNPRDIHIGNTALITVPSEGNPGNGKTTQELPAEILDGCVIRNRRPGDRIRPFGMEGSRKLQDYFTDRRIDEPWRDEIPLLCRGSEVLLAAGVGAGYVPRWNAERNNVRLIWKGELPWMNRESEG